MRNHFIELFELKRTRFLVILAVAGIVLTIYPVYNGLENETEKDIQLIQQWNGVDGARELPQDVLNAVYDRLSNELRNNSGKVETVAAFFSKPIDRHSGWQLIWKIFAGPALFFFTYGISLIFKLRETDEDCKKKVWRQNKHIYITILFMALINLLIPFVSPIINYIFVPSCLSLVTALSMELWHDVIEESRRNTSTGEEE